MSSHPNLPPNTVAYQRTASTAPASMRSGKFEQQPQQQFVDISPTAASVLSFIDTHPHAVADNLDGTTAAAMTETTIKQQRNFYPTTDSPPLSVHSNSPLHNAPQQLDLMCDGEMPPPPPPHNNNNSHLVPSCQQKEQIAGMLFGPFFTLSKPFFPCEFPQRRKLAKNLIFFGAFALLVGRAIFYATQLGRSANLSLDWAKASIQMSVTLNAVGALAWMRMSGNNNGFLRDFVRAMILACGQNHRPRCSRKAKVIGLVIACLYFAATALWALQRVWPVFGGGVDVSYTDSFICLDAAIALFAGFIGALMLGILHTCFRAVLAEWDALKQEHIHETNADMDSRQHVNNNQNGAIAQPTAFAQFRDSAIALLRFAHFTSDKLEQLAMGMFMTGIFLNISAMFIAGGGGTSGSVAENATAATATIQLSSSPLYNALSQMNNIGWSIASIILLVSTLKGQYDVHAKIREVKEQILLDDTIWNKRDEKLAAAAQTLIHRLQGIRIHRIGAQIFQLIFIAQMVLVWLLVNGSNCGSAKKA